MFSTTFRGISHQGLGIPSPCVYFPVHYPSLLVGAVSLCCPSLALRSCYYELDSLLGAFIHSATWILSVSVDSCFYGPGAQGLCCFFNLAFCSYWKDFFMSASSSICRWYIPRMDLVVRDSCCLIDSVYEFSVRF